jgi:tetratricopeptide (TPR) repeat protein
MLYVLLGLGGILTVTFFWAAEEERPEELPLRIIVAPTRSEAEDTLARLKAGESFEALAKGGSIDPSAPEGGYMGTMRLSTLRPEIREALQGVEPGEVTGVFQVPAGFMIVRVLTDVERSVIESRKRTDEQFAARTRNVRMAAPLVGSRAAGYFFDQLQKPLDWQQDLQAICRAKLQAPEFGVRQLEHSLGDSDSRGRELRPAEKGAKHQMLGQLWSYQGNMKEAIKHLQAAYELAISQGVKDVQLNMEEALGIAELRRGVNENWVKHHRTRSSIFPLSPDEYHKDGSGAERAIEHFQRFLEQEPDDLEAKWLLNLAYMMLGTYPQDVPKEHLVPLKAFESKEDIGRFVDVAPSWGLNVFRMAGGVIMDDFDNDGLLDLVLSSMAACPPLDHFHNNGDGTFTNQPFETGLSKNIIQTDYNNDGWVDVYAMRGGWEQAMRNSLLRNNGDGTFTDVTREAGLADPATATQTAVWADFDNDGNLDLFVGNEFAPSQLFHNNGDGTFKDVAPAAGVDRVAFTKGAVAGDYDGDGYPDIYVSNWAGENFLFHNDRDGTFTDVARQLGVQEPIISFPVWFFDYNNDGSLDLFVSSFVPSITEVIRSYLGLPVQAETLKLYRNTGGGSFQDATNEAGLERVFMPMGANFGDVDNDGFLDFYLGTGSPSYASLVPHALFRNREGKTFVDITATSGTGQLMKGHGIAFGDIDNDGDEDIFAELGGATPGDMYYSALFRNPGQSGNKWITIKLKGVKTNRAAIGARIKVAVEGEDHKRRFIYRYVTSGGSFGASPLQQHIGLGRAARIETLEIWWPTSDTRQIFRDIKLNQFIEITEFAESYIKLERRSFD